MHSLEHMQERWRQSAETIHSSRVNVLFFGGNLYSQSLYSPPPCLTPDLSSPDEHLQHIIYFDRETLYCNIDESLQQKDQLEHACVGQRPISPTMVFGLGGHGPLQFRQVEPSQRAQYRHGGVARGGGNRHDHDMNHLQRAFGHLGLQREIPRGLTPVGQDAFELRRHASERKHSDVRLPGYTVIKSLKTGGMSESIVVVKDKKYGKLYIAKRVPAHGANAQRAFAELTTLKRIRRGLNLNYIHEHFWSPGRTHLTLVLEHCDGGTLSDLLKRTRSTRQSISENFLWHVMLGIAEALAYLHWGITSPTSGSQPSRRWDTICHLDIKPANIFMTSSGQRGSYPRIVVGDFGCAVLGSNTATGMVHPVRQPGGTPGWFPPEGDVNIVGSRQARYGPASDIWALAACIQTLGRLIDGPDLAKLYTYSPVGSSRSRDLNHIVSQASTRDYRSRPNAPQLARHISRVHHRR